ncbi:lactate dehydrogenase-like 2-hydroxyacid dehydrogenase [Cupriavidus gilardii J11]|uniref:Lactate dehydrogenase-like 2-hydroxyacid dehydrogenase n=1 Tax=Cupriavidus gilardii J11 TaxID=936133 RepID=A0A562B145_9BURK|nr:2-hydroxyacid dehydrogenase [Cupriavidus gilardii]TWG78937.1 lactate dehydrogenase-like 2-hydroxyacid dehydrogenase [Cupriavidus gilardii J11]
MSRPILLVVTPFSPEALAPLHAHYEVVDWRALPSQPAFCREHGGRVRAMITNGMVGVPPACRDTMANLGVIACNGVGYDAIDVEWASARGIRVTNTPDILSGDVADLALALALAAFRSLPAADRFVREGHWRAGPFPLARRFWGSRVGIVGLGRIGRLIARRAAAFDTGIGYTGRRQQHDVPYAYYDSPRALAQWADVLIVATPGGEGTRHLVGRDELHALGADGVLVNVARGSVVDERALIEALHTGALGAAGLDVFEDEPRVPHALIESPRVVLTPHIASATVQTRRAMAELVAENLVRHAQGLPLATPVN